MITARILSDRLAQLLGLEHAALADFLLALAQFDRDRRWAELGHSSLFYFLHRELGLSKGAAFHRKVAAELIQRFPEVIEPLRDGRLCLSSVVELARVMTAENRADVLPRFFHCSKTEAKAVAVEIRPAEVVTRQDVVAALMPVPAEARAALRPKLVHPDEPTSTHHLLVTPAGPFSADRSGPPPSIPPARQRDDLEPLTSDLRRLHVTVSTRLLAKLEAARDGLAHSMPRASTAQVLEAALDELLAKQARRKGLVRRPRAAAEGGTRGTVRATASKRGVVDGNRKHVPTHVKREVWKRDGGRCQWPLESGGICGSTRFLELDHVVPEALGGPPTAANLRVLCRFHNQLAARQAFGDAFMERFTAANGRRRGSSG